LFNSYFINYVPVFFPPNAKPWIDLCGAVSRYWTEH